MKKDVVKERKQGTIETSVAMQQQMLPLLLAMDATKKGLLSFVQQMGMTVLQELQAPAGSRARQGQARGGFAEHGGVAYR